MLTNIYGNVYQCKIDEKQTIYFNIRWLILNVLLQRIEYRNNDKEEQNIL